MFITSERENTILNMKHNTTLKLTKLPEFPDDCLPKDQWIMSEIHYSLERKQAQTRVYTLRSNDWKTVADIVGSADIPKNATHFTILTPMKFLYGQFKDVVMPMWATDAKEEMFFFSTTNNSNGKHVELLGSEIKRVD